MTQPCPTAESAAEFVPDTLNLATLSKAAKGCHGCHLYCHATQTVFGEGPEEAPLMLVGEKPGNDEDKTGRPFTGPAGRMLDKALEEAGLKRGEIYLTNAVKHFKFIMRGSLRKHSSPGLREIAACKPWLDAEISIVRPKIIVCLGATAVHALIDKHETLRNTRRKWFQSEFQIRTTSTIHPSAILRARNDREQQYNGFVSDLKWVAAEL